MADIIALTVIFVAAAAAVIVADRLPVPQETLYILVGILIGQTLLDLDLTILAEAGAVFAIFLAAMHLQTDAIQDVAGDAVRVSIAQTGLLVAAAVLATALGFSMHEAVLIGLVCGLSSSMLGVDLIGNQVDRRLLHGRLTEGINFMQDTVAILLIGILPFWPNTMQILLATAAVSGILLAAMFGRQPVRHVLKWLDREEEATLLIGLAVLWAVAAVAGMHPYGTIIAAVTAGVLLSGHPENITLLETLHPVKDFFAALFFVVLGALTAPGALPDLYLTVALFLAATVLRPVMTAGVLWLRGVNPHTAITTALQLDQVSEIVLLLALLFQIQSIVSPSVTQAVIFAAAGSFIYSSYTTQHSDLLYHRYLSRFIQQPQSTVDHDRYTIIAGYGTLGQAAANAVDTAVIIDNDPDKIQNAQDDGHDTVMGDIHDTRTWHRAGMIRADAIILTTPSDTVATRIADTADPSKLLAITETPDTATALESQGVAYAADTTTLAITHIKDALTTYLDNHLQENQ